MKLQAIRTFTNSLVDNAHSRRVGIFLQVKKATKRKATEFPVDNSEPMGVMDSEKEKKKLKKTVEKSNRLAELLFSMMTDEEKRKLMEEK